MTRPTSYLIRMIVFCVVVYGVAAVISPALAKFYMANPVINSVIVAVEIFGVFWNLRQVQRLNPEVVWVEHFRRARHTLAQACLLYTSSPRIAIHFKNYSGRALL